MTDPASPQAVLMTAAPASGPVAGDRIGVGIGTCVAAVFVFSIVDATAKWLGQTYAPVQIVFFQYLFGMIPVAVLVWRNGGLSSLRTRRPFAHALRSILLFVTALLFFTPRGTRAHGVDRRRHRRRGRRLHYPPRNDNRPAYARDGIGLADGRG